MPVVSPSSALLEPRFAALVEHLPGARRGTPKAVHQARVASRRLREILPVIGPAAGARRARRAIRSMRTVTRALGPVRELDVTLQLLEHLGTSAPELALAVRLVERIVAGERRRRRAVMLDELTPAVIEQALRDVRRTQAKIARAPDDGQWRARLATRAVARTHNLMAAVEDAGLLFDPVRLHQVRISAKQLRYTLELTGDARLCRTARFVAALKDVQERLGHLHDLQVLLTFARAPQLDAVPRHRAALGPLRDLIERQCHWEHARYVKRRPRLLVTCETVLGSLGGASASTGRSMLGPVSE